MIVGKWANTCSFHWPRILSLLSLAMLAGCSGGSLSERADANRPDTKKAEQPFSTLTPKLSLTGLIPVSEPTAYNEPRSSTPPGNDFVLRLPAVVHTPALVRLPAVVDESPMLSTSADLDRGNVVAERENMRLETAGPLVLLPPVQPVNVQPANVATAPAVHVPLPPHLPHSPEVVTTEEHLVAKDIPAETTAADSSTEGQQSLDSVVEDNTAAATGVLTDTRINELATTKIRKGYTMANRGAFYSARREFVEVLRMISRAKDSKHGTPRRTLALAEGLRALEEAKDFAPQGTQLEAELDVHVICASHRTPIGRQTKSPNLLPQQIMDRYLRYAQLKLANSVSGEPAGSMSLHALGKLSRRLGKVEPEKHPLADRLAIAFQQAALLAHNENHLAAHELGVLLAESGHLVEAENLLQQICARKPHAIVFQNLANVQQKLGRTQLAAATYQHAQQLAQQGVSDSRDIAWVSPEEFARSGTFDQTGTQIANAPKQSNPPSQIAVPSKPRRGPLPSLFFWR